MDERRYFGLDALRGGMMMLGIVLHGAMLYLVAPPVSMPIPTDRNNALVFDFIFSFIGQVSALVGHQLSENDQAITNHTNVHRIMQNRLQGRFGAVARHIPC